MPIKFNLKPILWLTFLVGTAIGLFLQFTYHKFLNFDTLAYINIAELYAKDNLKDAVNACWSPMYSWILASCKMVGLPLLESCYVLNFAAAAVCFNLLLKMGRRFLKDELWYAVFGFYTLFLLMYFAMSTLTPDLLAAAFSLWFIRLITRQHFFNSKTRPLLAGVAAAAMYFAKSYNFVAVHLFLLAFLLIPWFTSEKVLFKRKFKQLGKLYLIFISLCLPWITVISGKEDKATFSNTGRFTHNLVSPDYKGYYPIYNKIQPPPENAYFFMIDPTNTLDEYEWSPFESWRNFQHQLSLIWDSIRNFYLALDNSGVKGALLLASLIILYLKRKEFKLEIPHGLRRIIGFTILYPLFYLPIFMTDRYVYVCIFLFHLILFYFIQQASTLVTKKYQPHILIGLLVLSLIPFGLLAKKKLSISSGEYGYYKEFSKQLPNFSFLTSQYIAADPVSALECVQLCYRMQCTYYATWMDKKYESLKSNSIRYYITKTKVDFPFLQLAREIQVKGSRFYIYEVL